MSTRFEHHARLVTLLTGVSRVTGLAREAVISRIFGAGATTDAFFFAFLIPNLFRRLFGEGALAAAFLPEYARLNREDPALARRLATRLIGLLLVGLGALVILGELVLLVLLRVQPEASLALRLMMIMLPYMPLVCVVAALGAMLQVHGRFGPPAAAPIVLNACIIAAAVVGGVLLRDATDVKALSIVAASVVVAGVIQVIWASLALPDREAPGEGSGAETVDAIRAPLRRILGQALPMMLGLGVIQINTLFDGLIASYPSLFGPTIGGVAYPLEEGALSALNYAQRLYQLPLGVFGIAVATAIFPTLSRIADDADAFADVVRRGLRLVVFIGLPASLGLVLVRSELAAVTLQGGRFDADDTARVARVLFGYAPAIWAYSMVHVLTRAFYARQEAQTPVRIAVWIVALNLVLNLTLIWTPLREAGLAVSTSICSVIQVLILTRLLQRRLGEGDRKRPLIDGAVRRSWSVTLMTTLLMGAVVFGVLTLLGEPDRTWTTAAWRLTAGVAAGVIAYLAVAQRLAPVELRAALGRRGQDPD